MLAHDSRFSSGIGSSLNEKHSIYQLLSGSVLESQAPRIVPLADHLVDLLDGEAEVGRLEAGVLVRLEQGVVVHPLVEIVPCHLRRSALIFFFFRFFPKKNTFSLPSGISSLEARTAPAARSGTL